jgi:DNA-binding HxlR family transcriptional regulator
MSSEPTAVSWTQSQDGLETPVFADPTDAFEDAHVLLGRKWHLRIVYHLLADGALGFSALKDSVVGVSSKMLSESLSTLEDRGIVDREIVNEQPVRVEYSLTERGRALEPVVSAVVSWGHEYGLEGEAQ